jgi:hypothetical protein
MVSGDAVGRNMSDPCALKSRSPSPTDAPLERSSGMRQRPHFTARANRQRSQVVGNRVVRAQLAKQRVATAVSDPETSRDSAYERGENMTLMVKLNDGTEMVVEATLAELERALQRATKYSSVLEIEDPSSGYIVVVTPHAIQSFREDLSG